MIPQTPRSSKFFPELENEVPIIDSSESFSEVVSKLSVYITKAIDSAYTYEALRTTVAGHSLRPLISSLVDDCHHEAIVAALLATRYDYCSTDTEDSGLNESRALACELIAWQFLTYLSEKELIDALLYDLPAFEDDKPTQLGRSNRNGHLRQSGSTSDESAPLLQPRPSEYDGLGPPRRATFSDETQNDELNPVPSKNQDDLAQSMAGMNALEIAAICDAKKFLSQKPVQSIVEGIWNGDIIFWDSISLHAVKKARTYNKRISDPFARLRVPKYQKAFQVVFFIVFLILYYLVLIERNPEHIGVAEVFLFLFILAYAYDEFGEILDAGVMFYQTDFWSLWDLAIILVGAAFFITRVVGLVRHSDYLIDTSFDILSLVALFLVPRIFSIFSLNSYFGSLIPVLKEMTKAFCNFLPVIVVLYLGFLTTFTMLARTSEKPLTTNEMSWLLVKVFFGRKISQILGYPLMLVFVTLTNVLLLTALVSLVSNSLTEVMAHAREEYLFQYSIYVLETSTNTRLTYFMPPLNLVPLLLRPLRLFMPSEHVRSIRIVVLKATHVPFVALIWIYERSQRLVSRRTSSQLAKAPHSTSRPLSSSQMGIEPRRDLTRLSPTGSSALTKAPRQESGQSENATTDSASTAVYNAELVALVQTLALKVDGLTAMVAGQQRD